MPKRCHTRTHFFPTLSTAYISVTKTFQQEGDIQHANKSLFFFRSQKWPCISLTVDITKSQSYCFKKEMKIAASCVKNIL